MRTMRATACAAILLVSLTIACRKDETPTNDTASAAAGIGGRSAAAQATTTALTPVTLRYFGTMAHLLGLDDKRAVFMRRGHTASMTVVKGIARADLEKAWQANEISCKSGECTVPLTDRSIQFAEKGTVFMKPSITTLPSFDNAVPHLARITGSSVNGTGHGKFGDLQQEVKTIDPPPVGNRISAWVVPPSGELSTAKLNYWTGRFDPDHEMTKERDFAEDIELSAKVDTPTVIVRKGSDKWELPVTGDLVLSFKNEPINGKQHFHLFYDLASGPMTDFEDRPHIRPIRRKYAPALEEPLLELVYEVLDENMKNQMASSMTDRTTKPTRSVTARERKLINVFVVEVPGCSNSQWP